MCKSPKIYCAIIITPRERKCTSPPGTAYAVIGGLSAPPVLTDLQCKAVCDSLEKHLCESPKRATPSQIARGLPLSYPIIISPIRGRPAA